MCSFELTNALVDILQVIVNKQDTQEPPSAGRSLQDKRKCYLLDMFARGYRHLKPDQLGGIHTRTLTGPQESSLNLPLGKVADSRAGRCSKLHTFNLYVYR